MHPTRLVGGLISLAALLTLLLVPGALLAEPSRDPIAGERSTGVHRPSPAPRPAERHAERGAHGAEPHAGAEAGAASAPSAAPGSGRAGAVCARELLRVARRQLGVPYVWGGASRGGFDCSGFTMYVYRQIGRSLPHGATDQARRGIRVSLRRLEPGDLVFWGGSGYYSHVAMYAGHGRVIEAPSAGKVVSYDRLSGAATARRLIGK